MRRLIILGISIAALAVPAAGLASVAVDANGYGFVGKGDVQAALGGISDDVMQSKWTAGDVKFTTSYNTVDNYTINCIRFTFTPGSPPVFVNTGATVHYIYTTPVTQEAKVTANTNKAGKLTNGWNLTGFDGLVTNGTVTKVIEGTCPSGTLHGQPTTPDPVTTTGLRSGLMVNGVPLPNTPVIPAP